MNKYLIADAIIKRVNAARQVDFSLWRIGITNDISRRAAEHKDEGENIKYGLYWQAESLVDAQEIESYFINAMGMKGGTGGNLDPKKPAYVYIF